MKKMWKLNNKAVSPVIATILMVAITVVLAAVLYVMVMGFGGTSSSSPTASITTVDSGVSHQKKVVVASISENVPVADMKLSLTNGTHSKSVIVGTTMTLDATDLGGSIAYTVTFIDLAGDGKVSSGDYFLIGNPAGAAGNTLTINLLYGGDSASIASTSYTLA